MSKGVVIFAFNNELIDYEKIAKLNASMIKYNMDVPVHIITDAKNNISPGKRHYKDYNQVLSFNNSLRWNVFELSPFDETLVLDADYLIMNNHLNAVWNSRNELMINTDIVPLFSNEFIEHTRLNDFTEDSLVNILSLPVSKIVTAKPEDEIVEFKNINHVKVKIVKPNKPNEFIVNSIKNTNVHFLNKKTILDNCNAIMELYQ
jgi:hypothetical protein